MNRRAFVSLVFLSLGILSCSKKPVDATADAQILRVGFFPNLTHAQGVIGFQQTRTDPSKAWFESRLGNGVKVEWFPFNAGPSAMEALLAGNIDITYVGPNPALNAYTRTGGKDVRVISGAARGGAALIIRQGTGLSQPADFRGKKIATPQLGGTQDVAARVWLANAGLDIRPSGGDAFVTPTPNPDQLDLFKRGEIDAAWTVEPWTTRLELEAGGQRLLEQNDITSTLLVASVRALESKRGLIEKFKAAHLELTAKIATDTDWAKTEVNAGLKLATTRGIAQDLLDKAWPKVRFTEEIGIADFQSIQADAKAVGLLPAEADLTLLFSELPAR